MKKYHLVVILVFKIHVVEMIQTFGPGNINAASISLTTNKPSYISQKYQSTAKINNLVTKCEEEVKKTLTETQRDNSLLKDIQSNQNLISSKQNTITKCDQETIKTKPLSVVNKTQVITLSTKIFPLSTLNKNLITINKCEDETLITKSRSNEKLISIEKKITVSTKVLTNLDQTLNITQIITSPTKVSTLSASSKNKSPENLSDRENITTKNAQINMQNDKIISKCELEKETKKVIKNTTAIPKTSSGANEKYKTIIPTIITKCENEILYYKSTKSTITAKSLVITDLTTAKLVETKTKPIVTKYSSIISQDIFTTSTAGHETSVKENQISTKVPAMSSKLPTSSNQIDISEKPSVSTESIISEQKTDHKESTRASLFSVKPTTSVATSTEKEASQKPSVSEKSTILATKTDKMKSTEESLFSAQPTSTAGPEEETSSIRKVLSSTLPPISSKLPTSIEQNISQKPFVSEKPTVLPTKEEEIQSTQASSVSVTPTLNATTKEHQASEKVKQFSTTIFISSTSIEEKASKKPSVSEKSTISVTTADELQSPKASSVPVQPTSCAEEHQTSTIKNQVSTTLTPISSKLPTSNKVKTPSQKSSLLENTTISITMSDLTQSTKASSVPYQPTTCADEHIKIKEVSTTGSPITSKLPISIQQETSKKAFVSENSTVLPTKPDKTQFSQESSVSIKLTSTKATEEHQTSAIEKQFSTTVSPISSKLPTTIEQETSQKSYVSEKSTILATKTDKTQSTQASSVSGKPTSSAATEEHQISEKEKQFSTTVSLTSSKLQTSIEQETPQKSSVSEKSTIAAMKTDKAPSSQASSVSDIPTSTTATEEHQTSVIEKQFSTTVSPISSKLPTTIEQETSQKPSVSEKSTILATKTDKAQSSQASSVSGRQASTVATEEHQTSKIEKQFSTTVLPTSSKLQTSINQETSQKPSVLEKSTIVETKNVEIQSTQALSVSRKPISTEATEGHQTSAIGKQFSSTVSPISSKLPTTIEQETSEKPTLSEKSTILATKTDKTQSTQASLVSDKSNTTAATKEHQSSAIEIKFSTTVSPISLKLLTTIEQETSEKPSLSEKSTLLATKTDKTQSTQASLVSDKPTSTAATEEHQTSAIEKQFSTTVSLTSSKFQTSVEQEASQKYSGLEKSTIVVTKNVKTQPTQVSSVSDELATTAAAVELQTSEKEKQFRTTVLPTSSKLQTSINQETSQSSSVLEKSTIVETKNVETQSTQASLVSYKPTSTSATEEHQTSSIEKQFSTPVSPTSLKLQTSINQETPQKSSLLEKSTIAAKTDKAQSSQASSVSSKLTSTAPTEEHQTSEIEKQFSTTVSPMSSSSTETKTSIKPSLSGKSTFSAITTDKLQTFKTSSIPVESTSCAEEIQFSTIKSEMSTKPISSKLPISVELDASSKKSSFIEKTTILATKNDQTQSTRASSVSVQPTTCADEHKSIKRSNTTESPISSKLSTSIEQETSQSFSILEKSTILATKTDKTQSNQASLVSSKSTSTGSTEEQQSSGILKQFSTTVLPMSSSSSIESKTSIKPSVLEKSTLPGTIADDLHTFRTSSVSVQPSSCAEEHLTPTIKNHVSTKLTPISSKLQISKKFETSSQKSTISEKTTISVTKNDLTQSTKASSVPVQPTTCADEHKIIKQLSTTELSPISSKLLTNIEHETSQKTSVSDKSTFVSTKTDETKSTQASSVSNQPTSTDATEEQQTSKFEKKFSTTVSPNSSKLPTSVEQETSQKPVSEKSTDTAKYTKKTQTTYSSSVSSKPTSSAATEEYLTSAIEKQFSSTVSPISSKLSTTIKQETSHKHSVLDKSSNFVQPTNDTTQSSKVSSIQGKPTSFLTTVGHKTNVSTIISTSMQQNASKIKSSFIQTTTSKHDTMMFDYTKISQETFVSTKQRSSKRPTKIKIRIISCNDSSTSNLKTRISSSPVSSTSADIGTTLEASTTSSTIATVTLQDSTMQQQQSTDSTTSETSTDVLSSVSSQSVESTVPTSTVTDTETFSEVSSVSSTSADIGTTLEASTTSSTIATVTLQDSTMQQQKSTDSNTPVLLCNCSLNFEELNFCVSLSKQDVIDNFHGRCYADKLVEAISFLNSRIEYLSLRILHFDSCRKQLRNEILLKRKLVISDYDQCAINTDCRLEQLRYLIKHKKEQLEFDLEFERSGYGDYFFKGIYKKVKSIF